MRSINPTDAPKPASAYHQAVVVPAGAERLIVSGQIGVRPDGTVEVGLPAQMEQAMDNIFACLRAAGFAHTDLVKLVTYVTVSGQIAIAREIRDRKLAGHRCASTYLEIAGLAAPEFLVEIEAEAVKA